MSKTTRSDWSASTPWAGITGKPDTPGSTVDIGQLTANGFVAGQVPLWNGTKFVPYSIPASGGGTTGDDIQVVNSPGMAMLRQPPGLPYGPTQKVWAREWFDLRQYGAQGDGVNDDTAAINRVIADFNTAGGGFIYAPAGNYLVAGTLATPLYAGMVLGGGMGVTRFRFQAANGWTWGNGAGGGGFFFGLQSLSLFSDGTSGGADAIYFTDGTGGSAGCVVNQVEFSGTWGRHFHGINLQGGGLVKDCIMRGGGAGVTAQAVRISNGFGVLMSGCRVANCAKGVEQENACDSCDVTDNLFDTCATIAVDLTGGSVGVGSSYTRVYNHYLNCPDPPVWGDATLNQLGDLWPARANRLGLVKIGSGITVLPDGTISDSGGSSGMDIPTGWLFFS